MNVSATKLPGLVVIEPTVFGDQRGCFFESWNEKTFAAAGLSMRFVQDNQSRSCRGVVRGLHFQTGCPQGKLVRVIRGEVFDVAVDIRKGSPTFGMWEGVLLSEENRKMLYVPEGFAHGFSVLSETAEFVYKCTDFYCPSAERGIAWNDPEIGVDWHLPESVEPRLSAKDAKLPCLNDIPPSELVAFC